MAARLLGADVGTRVFTAMLPETLRTPFEQLPASHFDSHFARYVGVANDIASQFDVHQPAVALAPSLGSQQLPAPNVGDAAGDAHFSHWSPQPASLPGMQLFLHQTTSMIESGLGCQHP